MLANDLSSYSIMLNGEKAITHLSPHYAPIPSKKFNNVELPPITSYVKLTEKNLNSLNSHSHSRSSTNTPPSLTTSSSASESPLSSPRMSASVSPLAAGSEPTRLTSVVTDPESASQFPVEASAKKRRQRLGPSCDNCRSRKVKCNAEVLMLSRNFSSEAGSSIEEYVSLSPAQKQGLSAGESLRLTSNFVLVLSNSKLIKFKPCSSCASKSLTCCFSKGFTKEDIIHCKRTADDALSPITGDKRRSVTSKVFNKQPNGTLAVEAVDAKPNSRKSSCVACRRRKVKCVVDAQLNKCTGCVRKGVSCSLENH